MHGMSLGQFFKSLERGFKQSEPGRTKPKGWLQAELKALREVTLESNQQHPNAAKANRRALRGK